MILSLIASTEANKSFVKDNLLLISWASHSISVSAYPLIEQKLTVRLCKRVSSRTRWHSCQMIFRNLRANEQCGFRCTYIKLNQHKSIKVPNITTEKSEHFGQLKLTKNQLGFTKKYSPRVFIQYHLKWTLQIMNRTKIHAQRYVG